MDTSLTPAHDNDTTHLAEQFALRLIDQGAVQPLVAETTFEAGLVPLVTACHLLLGGVDSLAAGRALGAHLAGLLDQHLEIENVL